VKQFLLTLLEWFVRLVVSLRYRVHYKGLDELKKNGKGALFLPNHPTMLVDPLLVCLPLWKRFRPRALITEYMFYAPGIYRVMRWIGALPVPAFETKNSVKIARTEETFKEAAKTLREGRSILIYPAGQLKQTGIERIGGASGVQQLLQEVPGVNVVLVRITGLWGSSYSRAYLGRTPPLWPTIRFSFKKLLKNFIFFMPRRDVTIEYVQAPADFPANGSRQEINRYLESWYNTGHKNVDGTSFERGEPFVQVSYSRWGNDFLEKFSADESDHEQFDLNKVDCKIKNRVLDELAKISGRKTSEITPKMFLADDLALDSLDAADLILFLEEEFGVKEVSPVELTTVGRLMAIAGKVIQPEKQVDEDTKEFPLWDKEESRPLIAIPEGNNIAEVFLKTCDRMGNKIACMDHRSGVLTYNKLKVRALLLAEKIRHMPGEKIGILLPASVGATVLIMATLLAKKIPVMINWTVGSRHLTTVKNVSGIQTVLTAWSFIDKLDNVDLSEIHHELLMLEELRLEISIFDKLKAFVKGYIRSGLLTRILGLGSVDRNSDAVLLFTSGTESMPKGVPLSHHNLLTNIRSGFSCIQLNRNDSVLAFLPPFHSFGFTMTGIFPILCGVKVAYSPNPTESYVLVREIEKRGITMVCGAPTFLKGILKSAATGQLKTLRMVVSGAERTPPELLKMVENLGSTVQFLEGYGITECAPLLTIKRPGTKDAGVGIPVPGVKISIVHPETYQPVAKRSNGLILACGENVFKGYQSENPIASPFLMIGTEKWYKTGDLGYLDENGCLILSGRMKRFVKIGGEMVSLAALESALLEKAPEKGWQTQDEGPSIAVCAKEDAEVKTQLFAFTRFNATTQELNQALREGGFSNIVRLTESIHLDEIPVTGTGKIDYRALESLIHKPQSGDAKV
jgi:acyl-CoA synthetase (AMP-forming)/AMP-acid ligase II/1-acyl-sn-glycerol-3-phosphate acyltransferase/acyl carrier protein